jgi:hypothetical protein
MPVVSDKGRLADRNSAAIPGAMTPRVSRLELLAVREEGGEVRETIARGERSARASRVVTVRGTVFDSTRMAPLPNARVFLDGTQFAARSGGDGTFAIEQVPEGTYTVSVVHARFDSLDARPPSIPVEVKSGEEPSVALAVPTAATIFGKFCTRDELAAGPGILRGVVRDAESAAPVPNAEITVSWKRLVTSGQAASVSEPFAKTRSDSAGRYWVCGLPDGVRATARASADQRKSPATELLVAGGELAVLDMGIAMPVVTVASSNVARRPVPRNRAMAEVERRRRRGGGAYMSRDQIDRTNAGTLTDLIRSMPSVSVTSDENGATIVELRRTRQFTYEVTTTKVDSTAPKQPLQVEPGGKLTMKHCPAKFYMDGLPIDGGASVDNQIRPSDIEVLEVYSGSAVPIQIATHDAECGVVLIWTRAFAERVDSPTDGQR